MNPIYDQQFEDFFDFSRYHKDAVAKQSQAVSQLAGYRPQQHHNAEFQQLDADMQHVFADPMFVVWNSLKPQINDFNKLVVIRAVTYTGWTFNDKARVVDYMR